MGKYEKLEKMSKHELYDAGWSCEKDNHRIFWTHYALNGEYTIKEALRILKKRGTDNQGEMN